MASAQTSLLLERSDRIRLINAAIDASGMTTRQYRTLKALLHQIEYCTFEEGCCIRVEKLAERMDVCHRSANTAIKRAEELGWLVVDRDRFDERTGCQRPNRYAIVWDELQAVVRQRQVRANLAKKKPVSFVAGPPANNATRPATSSQAPAMSADNSIYSNLIQNPPPPRRPADSAWLEVERQLAAVGLVDAVAAVDSAKTRGLPPAECLALIAYFRAHAAAWKSPAALHYRLRTAIPGRAVEDGWPPRLTRPHDRPRPLLEPEPPGESDRDRAARLETDHGAELDELTAAERDELARRCFQPGPLLAMYQRDGWRRSGPFPGMVRRALLEALAATESRT